MVYTSNKKSNTPLIILLVMITLCFICFICYCCICLLGGGWADWKNSECLATRQATDEQRLACNITGQTEDECEAKVGCWYRHSLITMMMDGFLGGD